MRAPKLTRRHGMATLLGGLLATSLPRHGRARAPLRIGMIGSGHVGGTLGGLWIRAGHQVMFSALDLREAQERAGGFSSPLALAGSTREAAQSGDVVVLAVPYGALPQLGHAIGPLLGNRPLIDATNPYPWRDGRIGRQAQRDGAGVTTQALFPGAALVRAFNSEDMTTLAAQSNRPPPRMALPMAGNVTQALYATGWLIHDAGFDPVMAGPLSRANLFQPGGPAFEARMTADELRAVLDVSADEPVGRTLAAQFSGGR
ncbi:oxidoreductase [Komagataeibacter melaceti]|uniref:Oxidoreductase n=1 Tax=Komagataeibacter melaceti TaxID=2766577 RepID=A0A371Z3U0_9PROT|nr:NAD(P)-binding domain-containing protein [Komagataeibacter melaceti]RFD21162.1 oxidoreductase [Komagataeibacter melaceti]